MHAFQGKKRGKCVEFHFFFAFSGRVLVIFQTYEYPMSTLEFQDYAGHFRFSKFHIEIYILFV